MEELYRLQVEFQSPLKRKDLLLNLQQNAIFPWIRIVWLWSLIFLPFMSYQFYRYKMTRSWHVNSPRTDLKRFIKRQTRYKQSCLDQRNYTKSCGKAEDRVTLFYQLFQSIHLTWLNYEISLKLFVVYSRLF